MHNLHKTATHTATKIPFMYSFSGNCAASLSPNFHIPVSVSDLCIFPESVHRIGRLIVGKYKSLTDTWMWKLGLWPRKSFFYILKLNNWRALHGIFNFNLKCKAYNYCLLIFITYVVAAGVIKRASSPPDRTCSRVSPPPPPQGAHPPPPSTTTITTASITASKQGGK